MNGLLLESPSQVFDLPFKTLEIIADVGVLV